MRNKNQLYKDKKTLMIIKDCVRKPKKIGRKAGEGHLKRPNHLAYPDDAKNDELHSFYFKYDRFFN